jgi:glucose-6-phosphate isomerase
MKAARTPAEIERIASLPGFEGNRPTNSILIKKLSPHTLGSLIALYEQKFYPGWISEYLFL